MTNKETSKIAQLSLSESLLEETVDFEYGEEQQDADGEVACEEKGEKTTPTKSSPTKQPAQQQQQQQQQRKNNSQVSQRTIRHRNSSKKKAFSGQVAARLEQAVAQASSKPVNRSADLVPLTHEYDKMKRRLRALITAAKQYHESMGRMYRARMEVVVRLATVATGTPIHDKIGNNGHTIASGSNQDLNLNDNAMAADSLTYIHKLAYKQCRVDAMEYQDTVVSYIVEWERVITSRVDNGLDQVFELNAKMNHYQTKVGVLRKRMHQIEKNRKRGGAQSSRSTTSSSVSTVSTTLSNANPFVSSTFPAKMESKLSRNQDKLEEAWKAHEAAASTLCHVLEQVTRQGWKDLVPLVECMIEFESIRASHDSGVFEERLEKLQRELNELVKQLQEFDEDEKKTRLPATRLLSAPALEVPIMLTSSSDGVESDDGFEDEDEDSRDDGSETSEDSSAPEAEETTSSETNSMSSSMSPRTNNSPNKSSSISSNNNSPNNNNNNNNSNNSNNSHNSNNNNKGIGVRGPPTRITAV